MKNILLSVKEKYVNMILNGTKTIELRKSLPKEKCVVYIYCCKCDNKEISGKIVGKFILDDYIYVKSLENIENNCLVTLLDKSNISYKELYNYVTTQPFYCWHINKLKIFKRPKICNYKIPQSWNYI